MALTGGCNRGASVTFEPGARTAWHTHPLGQTLIVTSVRPTARGVGSTHTTSKSNIVTLFGDLTLNDVRSIT